MTVALVLAVGAGCSSRSSSSEPEEHAPAHAHGHGGGEPAALPAGFQGPGKLELPEDLRALVIAEMVQVESAMHGILSALVRGDLAKVATTAQAVHDSFILSQQLTEEQAHRLHELLPPEFVTLDERFHRDAAELAKAAGAGDAVRAAEIYGRMSNGCVSCHSAYARERFPGLASVHGAEH